jgi:hypothetical protein
MQKEHLFWDGEVDEIIHQLTRRNLFFSLDKTIISSCKVIFLVDDFTFVMILSGYHPLSTQNRDFIILFHEKFLQTVDDRDIFI